jgi:hypothetical protein
MLVSRIQQGAAIKIMKIKLFQYELSETNYYNNSYLGIKKSTEKNIENLYIFCDKGWLQHCFQRKLKVVVV